MKHTLFILFAVVSLVLFAASDHALAHCEIPCGIYDDAMRFDMIAEHIATIEKSMIAINTLAPSKAEDTNQLVRWIANKEKHADEIQSIVSQYFLTQRVKIPQDVKASDHYVESLKRLHELLVYAMKAKQTTDLEYVHALKKTMEAYRTLYMKMHGH